MKKIISTILIAASLMFVATNFSSCKKYEDGPSMSLRSKKARLVGKWEIEKYFLNEKDYTHEMLSVIKDNSFTFKSDGTYEVFVDGEGDNGKWEFNSDKTKILITIDNETETWTIRRLTNSELWFEYMDDKDKIVIHFKSKD
ncbi:MAG: hypothetical protein LC109_12035 [Bacteroidia bacterium]|nr:hypothetical protein [Bacteroidia bacterium]MCO5253300.1 hypothetical protein [Bacteroidota bacterium]MCZ2130977.1 hypothetical protein [Bacteroidia bacterium]